MSDSLRELGEYIAGALGPAVVDSRVTLGELAVEVRPADIVKASKFLRDDPNCLLKMLIDVAGVDYPEREKRFDVVYHFLSPMMNRRVRVKIETDERTPVPTIIAVFRGADWFERETYDLYGVLFTGHPDMRRILTDYGFEGHPLRKDFPLTGFVEVFAPDRLKDVKLYDEEEPIFDEYGIEDEIGRALSRKVPLPSGGYLIKIGRAHV